MAMAGRAPSLVLSPPPPPSLPLPSVTLASSASSAASASAQLSPSSSLSSAQQQQGGSAPVSAAPTSGSSNHSGMMPPLPTQQSGPTSVAAAAAAAASLSAASSSSSSSSSSVLDNLPFVPRIRSLLSELYYRHGFFCASHPIAIIIFVIGIFTVVSVPLVDFSIYGVYDPAPSKIMGPIDALPANQRQAFVDQHGSVPLLRVQNILLTSSRLAHKSVALASALPPGLTGIAAFQTGHADPRGDAALPRSSKHGINNGAAAAADGDRNTHNNNNNAGLGEDGGTDAGRAGRLNDRNGLPVSPPLNLHVNEATHAALVQQMVRRGMLHKSILLGVMDIVTFLHQFQLERGGRTYRLQDFCQRKADGSCLVLSPADFWHNNRTVLEEDSDILSTISRELFPSFSDEMVSAKDALLLARIRKRSMLQIDGAGALFIVLVLRSDSCNPSPEETVFLQAMWRQLSTAWLPAQWDLRFQEYDSADTADIEHIFYEFRDEERTSADVGFLILSYLIVFLYISFSIGKFHMVKSKYGLGFTAVVTVFCSMIMAVSICVALGVKPTLVAVEIIPFLVIIVGVENIFVLTSAVVATSIDLPVKVRIAQGLSQAGPSITFSLLTELTIMVIGIFTSIPALQEFCVFGSLAILSDFFMQVTFFVTVLSIDIRRMELSDLHHAGSSRKFSEAGLDTSSLESKLLSDLKGGAGLSSSDDAMQGQAEGSGSERFSVLALMFDPLIIKTVIVILFMSILAFGLYNGDAITRSDALLIDESNALSIEATFSYWRLLHPHLQNSSLHHRHFDILPSVTIDAWLPLENPVSFLLAEAAPEALKAISSATPSSQSAFQQLIDRALAPSSLSRMRRMGDNATIAEAEQQHGQNIIARALTALLSSPWIPMFGSDESGYRTRLVERIFNLSEVVQQSPGAQVLVVLIFVAGLACTCYYYYFFVVVISRRFSTRPKRSSRRKSDSNTAADKSSSSNSSSASASLSASRRHSRSNSTVTSHSSADHATNGSDTPSEFGASSSSAAALRSRAASKLSADDLSDLFQLEGLGQSASSASASASASTNGQSSLGPLDLQGNWLDNRQLRLDYLTLRGHAQSVECLEVNDALVFSAGLDQSVRVWDLASGENVASIDVGDDSAAAVWCMTPVRFALPKSSAGQTALHDSRGRGVIVGCADGSVKFWTVLSAEQSQALLASPVGPSKVSPPPSSPQRQRFTVAQPSQVHGLKHSAAVSCLCSLPFGVVATASLDGTVRMWVVTTGRRAGARQTPARQQQQQPLQAQQQLDAAAATPPPMHSRTKSFSYGTSQPATPSGGFSSRSSSFTALSPQHLIVQQQPQAQQQPTWSTASNYLSPGNPHSSDSTSAPSTPTFTSSMPNLSLTQLDSSTLESSPNRSPPATPQSQQQQQQQQQPQQQQPQQQQPQQQREPSLLCVRTIQGIHKHGISAICSFADPLRLATGEMDGTVRVFDAGTGEPVHALFGHSGKITWMHADGVQLVTGDANGRVRVWHIVNGTCLLTLKGHTDGILCVRSELSIPRTAAAAAVASMLGAMGSSSSLVNSPAGPPPMTPPIHVSSANDHTAPSTPAATPSGSRSGALTSPPSSTASARLHHRAAVQFVPGLTSTPSPSQNTAWTAFPYLVTSSLDGTVRVWDRRGNCVRVIQHFAPDLVLLPRQRRVLCAGEGELVMFDLPSGKTARRLALSYTAMFSAAVSINHVRLVGGRLVCDFGDRIKILACPAALAGHASSSSSSGSSSGTGADTSKLD